MRTLRVDDQPGEDVRYQVRGAARILGQCVDALREPEEPDIHEEQERGADGK